LIWTGYSWGAEILKGKRQRIKLRRRLEDFTDSTIEKKKRDERTKN
jgi:hypothetical protein